MPEGSSIALLVVAILLVAVVAFSGVLPLLAGRKEKRAARTRMSNAITEGSDEKRPPSERAAAFVRAGRTALDDLGSPRLAARYAEWAHALAPNEPQVLSLVVDALTKAHRYHALERLLWISVDALEGGAKGSPALGSLIALYEGGLHRPERARVLRVLAA